MQSTRSASMRARRMSPSPDWLEDMLPLARTKPAMPWGARWWMKCCTQAKLALPLGGTPNCQRTSCVLAEPIGVVEGRVGEDVVGAEVGVLDVAEGVGVFLADVRLDAADGEVHDGQAAGGGVALLAVDADVAEFAAVGLHEFFRLHEHAAGAAGGVVDAAFVGGEHLRRGSARRRTACRTGRRSCPRRWRSG